ncbi:MAG: hypothetical protein IPK80_08445 [Nannocystis sp.]|jgi:hypothetical protein|nr:hypothetical protein [Nannocystis sp.]
MAVSHSPQLGYNHNIPHRGRLYHVQTEDSGIARAHIFTHVFFDGTIISSNKVEYKDKLEAEPEDLDGIIIAMMQESHKAMIRQLRGGAFDEKIVKFVGAHPDGAAKQEPAAAAPPTAVDASKRPERRPPPLPREVEPQGPPLQVGAANSGNSDPGLNHPIFSSREAQAQVAATAAGQGAQRPSRGPSRVSRRPVGGIGGQGVSAGTPVPLTQRRDVIVGKFASEHQAQLDEEILTLLRED